MHFDPNTGEKIMDPGDEIQNTADNSAAQATNTVNQTADAANQAAAQAAAAQAAAAQAAAAQAAAAQAAAAQAAAQNVAAQPQFQQAPGQAPETKVKKGLPIGAVIGIVAAVLVVLGGVAFFALRGLGGKVSLINTFTNAYNGEFLYDAAKDFKLDPFGDFTFTMNGGIEDVEFSVALASAASSHTRSAYASVTYDGFTIDANGYIDEKTIKAAVPVLGDYLFMYDYSNNKNDGFIVESLDDMDIDLEDFNALIGFMNDNSDLCKKFYNQSNDYFLKVVNGIDFDKTKNKETFTVNGKKVECTEYQAVITADDVEGWVEGYQELWEKFYNDNSDDFDIIEDITGEEFDLDDMFDDILDDVGDMEDLVISIYSKGATAACIRFTYDEDYMIEILFKGGDYLAQNLEVNYDFDGEDGTLLTIEGSTKGDVQTTTIEMEEEDLEIEYSYNKKTGELTMTCEMYGREIYDIECTVQISKNEIKYVYDSMEVYGSDIDFDSLEITISNKANITEPKKGEKIDLGNIDEDDFDDLLDEIEDELMDNDDLMDMSDELEELMWMFY